MKNFRFIVLALIATLCTSIWAADVTFTMANIFDGNSLSFDVTTPTAAKVTSNASKSNAKAGKLGSDGHYFEIILKNETFTAAKVNGYINTNDQSKNWAFQFSTDGGNTWGSEQTQPNDGNKTAHDIIVGATIPAGANGFRVVRRAGTSTQVTSITLTLGSSTSVSSDATLKSLVYGTDQTPVPGFSASTLEYTIELPAGTVGAPSVQATANDEKANVNITQATSLPGTAKIEVTAEDATTKLEYKVTFTVASNKPKVLNATWDNILDVAVIDNTGYTITGQVAHGSSLTLTPQFTGDYIASWTPSNAQDFSNGPVSYTFQSSTDETTTYAVAITEGAAPIEVTSIHLNKTSTSLYVGNSETLTVTYTPSDANTGKGITWSSDKESVATVDQNGKVTGVTAGTAVITATSEKGKTATCTVTVQAIAVTGVTLDKNSLTLKTGSSETLTATVLPSDAANKNVTWSSSDNTVATVENGKVTAIAEGTAVITVTTEDGNKTASCNVLVQAGSTVPETGLTVHYPEIYEDPAGYNTPLVKYQGREYEVFYTAKGKIGGSGSSYPLVYLTASGNEISNATKAKDGWFEHNAESCEDSNGKTAEEFTVARGDWKMQSSALTMHIKGYDQFRFFASDKKAGQQFEVYIDDEKKEMEITAEKSPVVRGFDISTGEHVIKVQAIGGSNIYMYGWSLRVTDDPIVRYLKGPKEQSVYQTKEIERVAFRVRRTDNYRLTWLGSSIPGVSLEASTNDSVFVQGTADAATGAYTYKLEALDKDGNVASFETGTILIETHVFDCRYGNDFSTNINEPIKPLDYVFYALDQSSISLDCDIPGLSLSFKNDSVVSLTGTPGLTTTEGTHTYSIIAAGGNTISGTITIVVPDPYFGPIADAKTKDNRALTFSVRVYHAANVTASNLPGWLNFSFDAATGLASFSGTPSVGAPYPKNYTYTLTAEPAYAGKKESSADGKVIVIDPSIKMILLACKSLNEVSEEPVANYLSKRFDITIRHQSEMEGANTDAFDLLLISEEADADNEQILNLIRDGQQPVLNLNGFTYTKDRLDWGEPDNGTIDTLSNNGCNIWVERADHPIFQKLKWQKGHKVQILSGYEKKGMMPIAINKQGTLCLATAYTRSITDYYLDGVPQTVLHEVAADARGGGKYICLPMARKVTLSSNGEQLLDAIVDYLLDPSAATITTPNLEITRFEVEGHTADINQAENTITLELKASEYTALDSLRNAKPVISLADESNSFVLPDPAKGVKLIYATYIPSTFTVTDYISRRVYEFSIQLLTEDGISEAYAAGQWVNVFDIYGRKVATTNEDIYTMDLPRGIYIIVTENGQTLKIMR